MHSIFITIAWLIALSSFTVKYKSLEKTILGQVYGKMLSFFITPSMCLLLCWWLWSKLSALSNGWICLNFPSFISTLGGFTYREKTEGDGFFQPCKIGLLGQNRRVVFSAGHSDMQLCRRKTCTNCSTPHGVAPLLFPFNRFLASHPVQLSCQ